MKITYFAVALNKDRKIEQVRVSRENGKPVSQEFTGKIYRTGAEAESDLRSLNCGARA